ncbi:MAG: YitT family protein [Verrucomicrobiota bacterium]
MLEDIYALAIGCSLIVLGILLLKSTGLVTGGVAGMALLLSYVTHWPVGTLFMLINLPFFIFAYIGMGLAFTIKTIVASAGIMAISAYAPMAVEIKALHPLYGSIFGGSLMGIGILSLARHGAGAGGTGVLCLYLQRLRGINAGKTQMAIDAVVISSALFHLNPGRILYSVLSAAAMSAVMVSYHKPARYLGH